MATHSLAEFIDRLTPANDRDQHVARALAQALHAQSGYIQLPAVEALGITDVIVTFHMDKALKLVVTGTLNDGLGQVTVTWEERDFPEIALQLSTHAGHVPYTFATLDMSVRGRRGRLLAKHAPLPAGQEVRIKVLATIGDRTEYRVQALGLEHSVPLASLELL